MGRDNPSHAEPAQKHLSGIDSLYLANESQNRFSLFNLPSQGHLPKIAIAIPGTGKIEPHAAESGGRQPPRKLNEQQFGLHPVPRKTVIQNHRRMADGPGPVHHPAQRHPAYLKFNGELPSRTVFHRDPPSIQKGGSTWFILSSPFPPPSYFGENFSLQSIPNPPFTKNRSFRAKNKKDRLYDRPEVCPSQPI
jgi:hypothetical protein